MHTINGMGDFAGKEKESKILEIINDEVLRMSEELEYPDEENIEEIVTGIIEKIKKDISFIVSGKSEKINSELHNKIQKIILEKCEEEGIGFSPRHYSGE